MGLYSRYIFPRLLEWSLGTDDVEVQRARTLAAARGSTLEIGFGTGLNLLHYPPAVSRLVALEPEPMLADRVERRIATARMPVEQVRLAAGRHLPFDDASFDTIVTTWTLCSIADLDGVLKEIRRVLKSDGCYLFCEHGRSDDPRAARIQDLLNPIQRVVGRGCNINRPIDTLIRKAGLELFALDRFVMPGVPRVFGEMYRGAARIHLGSALSIKDSILAPALRTRDSVS
jgi:SAM-dependent methyltransferase